MVKAIKEIWKCSICGNIVEVVHKGGGTLECCSKEMLLQTENTVDASKEKHIPVIEKSPGKVIIKVGAITHPMDPDHYIEFIELVSDTGVYKRYLSPGRHT